MKSAVSTLIRGFGFLLVIAAATPAVAQLPDNIEAQSTLVLRQQNDLVEVATQAGYQVGHSLLVVRLSPDDDFEVISNGKILKINGDKTIMRVDVDSLKKLPRKGDRVVVLSDPKTFKPLGNIVPSPMTSPDILPIPVPEAGYIHVYYYRSVGQNLSASDNLANSLKNLKSLNKDGFYLDWYLDYLSTYGVEIGTRQAKIPIESYYRNNVSGDLFAMMVRLKMRTAKTDSKFRFEFFLQGESENFTTNNPDEYILSTRTDSNLLGVISHWEPGDLLLRDKRWRFQFTRMNLLLTQSLSVQVVDGKISRGQTSNGSTINDMRLGFEFTGYFPKLKRFERWTFGMDYFMRFKNLKMSGNTASENSNFYSIPQNGAYRETETGFSINIGLRYDDFIGKIFKPRD